MSPPLPGLPCVGQSGHAGTDATAGAYHGGDKAAASGGASAASEDFSKGKGENRYKCDLCPYSAKQKDILLCHHI